MDYIKSILLRKYWSSVAAYEFLSKEQHEIWQFARIKRLLTQAERHVPYYRRKFREIGFTARDFRCMKDFEKIPFITKEDIRTNGPSAFCDERIPLFMRRRGNTGGSSGLPCPLLRSRPFSELWRMAFVHQLWCRIGYKDGDRIAVLRGRADFDKDQIYTYKANERRFILSTYDLNDKRLEEYIKVINDFQIHYLHVYPSSLNLFIDNLMRLPRRIRFSYLKGVISSSEGLFPNQKEWCKKVLGIPCYNWYGHSEMNLMGGGCETSEKFHFFPQYGHLELVDDNGRRINNLNDIGELVGTGFRNSAMILIRYRSGDLGSGFNWEKCSCGREFPTLEQIHGRIQEYIVTSDECKIPATCFFGLHLPIFDYYRKIQLEQFAPGMVTVRLESFERNAHFREIELSKTAMENALKGRVSFSFEEVDSIPPMANGKHKFVIQHLEAQFLSERYGVG